MYKGFSSMKKIFVLFTFLFISLILIPQSNAQMRSNTTPMMQQAEVTPASQDIADIQQGKDLFNKFQTKQLSCNQLKDADFEKIGEYLMNQSFGGNSNAHIQMNNNMKQMMGEDGEEQMHIRLAKNATGCLTSGRGGGNSMMGWNYTNMMGGFGILGSLFSIVFLIDLILLGIWLFKQIQKK